MLPLRPPPSPLVIVLLFVCQCSQPDIESSESGVALRDRVPVLDVSASCRNTSRMSGLRECRLRVRPRTVRFSVLTR